jgi:hypothetical protein
MLLLLEPECLEPGVSAPAFLFGVVNLYDAFNRSWDDWCASRGGGDVCMARTESEFRKRVRSLRARAPASFASRMGFEEMEDSEGIAETKLYCDDIRCCEPGRDV